MWSWGEGGNEEIWNRWLCHFSKWKKVKVRKETCEKGCRYNLQVSNLQGKSCANTKAKKTNSKVQIHKHKNSIKPPRQELGKGSFHAWGAGPEKVNSQKYFTVGWSKLYCLVLNSFSGTQVLEKVIFTKCLSALISSLPWKCKLKLLYLESPTQITLMPWSSTTSPLLSFASSKVFSAGASSNIFLKFCGKVNKPTDHRWRILGLLWEIMERKVIYVLWSFVADKMTFWLLLYKVWEVPNLKTINNCHIWSMTIAWSYYFDIVCQLKICCR